VSVLIDAARVSRLEIAKQFGREVMVARGAAGLTQDQLARRSGTSQPMISRVESGSPINLRTMARIARGLGQNLSVRLFPADGIRLRDSGQLSVAELIRSAAHPSWQVSLEVPVASAPDRRAADMVLEGSGMAIQVEIERSLRDVQAQLRAAQLKRVALSERRGRQVRLVLAVPDTAATRAAIAPHAAIIHSGLPLTSRAAWAAIRSGEPLAGDALLWSGAAVADLMRLLIQPANEIAPQTIYWLRGIHRMNGPSPEAGLRRDFMQVRHEGAY
jgi:transcriptional regulator with XRE-family HTH domain